MVRLEAAAKREGDPILVAVAPRPPARALATLLIALTLLHYPSPHAAGQGNRPRRVNDVPSPTPVASQVSVAQGYPEPDRSWWTYLIEENPAVGIAVAAGTSFLLAMLVLFGVPYVVNRRRRMPASMKRSRGSASGASASPDGRAYVSPLSDIKPRPYERGPRVTAEAKADETTNKVLLKADSARPRAEPTGMKAASPGVKAEAPPAATSARRSPNKAETPPATEPAWQPGWRDEVARLRDEMERLKAEMMQRSEASIYVAQRRAQEEFERLVERDGGDVRELILQLEIAIKEAGDQLAAVERQQAQFDKALHSQFNSDALRAEFDERLRAQAAETKKVTADSLGALRAEIDQLRAGLRELSEGDRRAGAVDSFYARTLGEILGRNVEALREGRFEELSRQLAERLNQFFKLDVPHGARLQELCARAGAINDALREVAALAARLNPRAAAEARPHLQRAEALAAELSGLQAQLQNRRATVETKLSIPVSLHAGARQTFLDELGRGLRREIDKLAEPQSHFDAELKRLVIEDVIGVADICDRTVAHPGANPELEASLSRLFAHAGLLPIVPAQGEQFREGEQELRSAVSDAAGKRLGVASVNMRGFYYEQQGERMLLRKARVSVYR